MRIVDRSLVVLVSRPMRRIIAGRPRSSGHPDRGRITAAQARRVVARAWRNYAIEAARLEPEPTWGSRLLTRLACLTLMTERSLEEEGVDPAEAARIVADINWTCYRPVANLSASAIRWALRDPAARLRANVRLEQGFPFSDPGYEHVRLSPYAYDIRRCPMADYLTSRGKGELCVEALCAMDFPKAQELWGARLVRDSTLAAGDDACRFRYEVEEPRP